MQNCTDACLPPQSSYTVLHFDHGIVIRGLMPAVDFYDLQRIFCFRYGYNHSDKQIAKYFKATMCLTTPEKAKKWLKLLNIVKEVEPYSFKSQYRKIENVAYVRKRSCSV